VFSDEGGSVVPRGGWKLGAPRASVGQARHAFVVKALGFHSYHALTCVSLEVYEHLGVSSWCESHNDRV